MITPFSQSPNNYFTLLAGDCMELIPQLDCQFDMIFADPPYFLSNGGISCQAGQVVCVDKGDWDKGGTPEEIQAFNLRWISACREKLKDNGTIWISGTYHNIFSVANALQALDFKILNVITWAKTNPPPNISCRFFTYSTEFIIWARKSKKVPHYYNYDLMKQINGDKQMTDVWRLPAIAAWEKSCGKHPTQKPLPLLARIIQASTKEGDLILDPFAGSSTTGIAAHLLGRRFIGIEQSSEFLQLSENRFKELQDEKVFAKMRKRLFSNTEEATVLVNHAKDSTRKLMIEKGICYLRAGESKGSLLVKQGFERLQYVLLHTNCENSQMFRLKKKGHFQIWTKEDLEKHGFQPSHAAYYVVLHFDKKKPITPNKLPNLKEKNHTYVAKIKPLSEFI